MIGAARYWAPRYFAPRYWAKVGAAAVAVAVATPSIFDQLLTHRYTRTPINSAAADQWGINTTSQGNAVTGGACFFNPNEQLRIGNDGSLTVRGPVLLVKASDGLEVGDQVSAINGAVNVSMEAGPLVVDAIDALTLLAGVEIKRARLRSILPRQV